MLLCVSAQAAMGYDYQEKLAQHESQTDAKKGFGGKYGVQKDRQDKVFIGPPKLYTCPSNSCIGCIRL